MATESPKEERPNVLARYVTSIVAVAGVLVTMGQCGTTIWSARSQLAMQEASRTRELDLQEQAASRSSRS